MIAEIGLHLGTRNLRLCHRKKQSVFSSPNIIARVKNGAGGHELKFGEDAQVMLGKAHPGLELVRPVSGGTISNLTLLEEELHSVFHAFFGNFKLIKPNVACSIPTGANNVEQRMTSSLLKNCGAQDVFLFPATLLAGISQSLPVFEPRGHMIMYAGAGFTDVAVVSLGGIVVAETIRSAGDDLNDAIIMGVRRRHDLMIGENTAEDVKCRLDIVDGNSDTVRLRGKDFASGLPREKSVAVSDVYHYMSDTLNAMLSCVKSVLAKTPPELLSDIVEDGLWLCGGTSRLTGFPELVQRETGLTVRLMESPEFCIIHGLLKLISRNDMLSMSLRKSFGISST